MKRLVKAGDFYTLKDGDVNKGYFSLEDVSVIGNAYERIQLEEEIKDSMLQDPAFEWLTAPGFETAITEIADYYFEICSDDTAKSETLERVFSEYGKYLEELSEMSETGSWAEDVNNYTFEKYLSSINTTYKN